MAESRLRTLLDFVEARAPGTLAHYPEVSAVQINRLLEACPSAVANAIPRVALDVLRWLGGSDEKTISIFGATYTTSITRMLDDLEFQVLAGRFYRVAIDRNADQITQDDLYVDLSRSDGEDAPLIVIADEWTGEEPPDRGHTISSMATRRVFRDFELGERGFLGHLARYYMASEREVRWEDYSAAMSAVAERMGLTEMFELRPDLRCCSSAEFALMFDALGAGVRWPEGAIEVWIGAADRESFLNYAAQIRSSMPPLPTVDEWRLPRHPKSPV